MMDCAAGAALGPRVGLNSSHGDLCRHLGSLRNEEASLLARSARTRSVSGNRSAAALTVESKKKVQKEWTYPWPKKITPDMEKDALKLLCKYRPLPSAPKLATLAFEKPIVELQEKIDEVRDMASKTGMDFSGQIEELEQKYKQVRVDLYKNLTTVERLSLARHPNRPTFYDHVLNMTDKWIELHGDRAGHDDKAIVSGIGKMDGMSFMFIGQQKGRNTKENIDRNFGMPQPWGYRKALRMMKHAAKHGFPILAFVDTPGAYAGVEAEEAGQGEAIAMNLREMFSLEVPIISTVIGEGGSGGALAIGCGNRMLMMENSVYYVASPEACAAILWKDSSAYPKAAEALKITPRDLMELKIVDEVIPEPLGGAQYDPATASNNIKQVLLRHMEDLLRMDSKTLLSQRFDKFRRIGVWQEDHEIDMYEKRNMRRREARLTEEEELFEFHKKQAAAEELLLPSSKSSNGAASAVQVDGVPVKNLEFAKERVTKSV